MQIKHNIEAGQLVIGASGLAAAISDMKGASKTWHKLTHVVAASAVVHAHTTGDVRPIQAALMAMPRGSKANSMRKYFETFAPVKWSEVAKKFKFKAERQVKTILEGGDVDLLAAILNKHWSDMGPVESADNFKPFDLQKKLVSLLNIANKRLEEDNGPVKRETMTAVEVNKLAETIRTLFPNGEAA